jgi:hypothetical protein
VEPERQTENKQKIRRNQANLMSGKKAFREERDMIHGVTCPCQVRSGDLCEGQWTMRRAVAEEWRSGSLEPGCDVFLCVGMGGENGSVGVHNTFKDVCRKGIERNKC